MASAFHLPLAQIRLDRDRLGQNHPGPKPADPPPPKPKYDDENRRPQGARSDAHHKNLYRAQKRFFYSLSLHDANKHVIAKGKVTPVERYWHPVKNGEDVIAYISFEKPNYVLKKNEAVFLQQLSLFFAKIAGIMVVASIIIAAVLSRWLIAPVSRISQSAREVANGNLHTRVQYQGKDEFGELCKNFNEMCEKLESNEVARKQWLADISHEMRTPVAVLKAQIEAMLDGIRKPTNDNIKLLGNKIESLEKLINDLYDLSLSDTGDLKLNLERIEFDAFVQEFIEDQSGRANAEGFELELNNAATDSTCIRGDVFKLLQILNNLLNNSLRYTDSPGKFLWTLSTNDKQVVLAVEDTAPGVDQSEIEKIFDRLYRVEKSRNRATGGAGLGLPLSRNIALAHGGNLIAEPSKLGGLKILLSLPRE